MKTSAAEDSPFVGLAYYTEQDAEFFFGRNAERTRIIGNLYASRLTLLYAQSGVGKSSLLRAGVAARLRVLADQNYAQEGSPHYVPVVFNTWTDDPVGGLIDVITEAAEPFRNGAVDGLSVPRGSFAEAINRIATDSDSTLLIILDQFEEYFLYRSHETGENSIAEQLARCISRPDVAANFLIAIREDAYARLGDLFKSRITNVYDNYLHLEYLDRQGGREAIAKPVELYNLRHPSEEPVGVEPELVESVLDQVAPGKILIGDLGLGTVAGRTAANVAQSVETPYLQLVMERLWREELASGGRKLRLTTLASMGGAKRIVQEHLDAALAGMPADQQEIAAAAFRYLVTPSGTKLQLSASDLAQLVDVPTVELETVLARLSASDARILREMASSEVNSSRYEIFHDVLAAPILEWHKQHEQVKEKAALAAQLEADQARREKERRNRLIRWAALALLGLVAGLAVLSFVAVEQRDAANGASHLAESRQLAAQAITQLNVDPAASVQLARQAADLRPAPEAADALRASLNEIRSVLQVPGDSEHVLAADFNAGGARLVSAGEDGTVHIWNAANGRILKSLKGHAGSVFDASFSPDGTRVVTAGADGTARVWDSSSGKELKILRGHKGPVRAASFSPDGMQIVTGGDDGMVLIWDSARGVPIRTIQGRGGKLYDAAFSRAGKTVVAASDRGGGRIWDASTGRNRAVLQNYTGPIYSAAFSPDGKRVVTAGDDGRTRIWDARTGVSTKVLLDESSCTQATTSEPQLNPVSQVEQCPAVRSAAFSPDGSLVVSGGDDLAVRIWNASNGRSIEVLRGHKGVIRSVGWSSNGSSIVTAGDDATMRVWRAPDADRYRELSGHKNSVLTGVFSPNGEQVLTGSADGTARIWDVATGRSIVLPVLAGRIGSVYATAFSPDGTRVVTAGDAGAVIVWDASTGSELAHLPNDTAAVHTAAFNPDGERVLISSDDGTARIWNVSTRKVVAVLHHQGPVRSAFFNRDGTRVVTASDDRTVKVWNASTGERIAALRGGKGAVYAAFAPDGRHVVAISGDDTARIWDSSTGNIVVLRGHTKPVNAVSWDPDGTRLVTSSEDRTAGIWEASTGKRLAELRGHAGPVRAAAFNADGHLVVTASTDGTARIWLASTGQLLEVLHAQTNSVLSATFSPEGRDVVTVGGDKTPRIYSCEICGSLRQLLALARHVSQ